MIPNELIKEIIFGEVVAKANHYQAVPDGKGGKRIIKDIFIREYERVFDRQLTKYRNVGIKGCFALYVDVFYRDATRDLDNSVKTILDCLQYGGAILNDNACIEIHATKHIDRQRPRIEFALQPFEPTLF